MSPSGCRSMEPCSFQSQVLAVAEVLARAAAAEMRRCVDDGCAVLRLQVSQSRRDIELLKRRCELLEAELRRSRARAGRRVRIILDKERRRSDRGAQADAGGPDRPQQVKEEGAEDELLKDKPEDTVPENSAVSPADGYDELPEEEVSRNRSETEIAVKPDEGSDENGAFPNPGQEGGGGGSGFSYAGHQFEQVPTAFTSHTGLHSRDTAPRINVAAKSSVASAARVKWRARTFRCKRPQPDEGHGALSQLNSIHQSSQPQRGDSAPGEDPAASSLRGGSGLARRMRTPWTSSAGEKRFRCTYCDKSFMRFSQLKEHLRSHTGEKPFSCLQCGRSFTKQCNLIRHAVVHSGEKPHECSLCGKCFTQRSSLKSHQKTAH